jgi:hypothetical protein
MLPACLPLFITFCDARGNLGGACGDLPGAFTCVQAMFGGRCKEARYGVESRDGLHVNSVVCYDIG